MQTDATLTQNIEAVTQESRRLAAAIRPGSAQWDVIVVGSGAAGGMAAFQLAMAGVKVLLLEAGRMIDVRTEYRTMEWPYASMRRHRLPPGERPIGVAEYNFLDRPYGNNPALAKYKKVASYSANTFTRNWLPDERENPTTGTPYALVRARILGGRTNFWGRGALRYGPMQFNAASRDGFDVDWPISYDDVKPYYDKVDTLLGCSGTNEGLVQVPDGVFQRPSKLNCVEVSFKRSIGKLGRTLIPGRAGVTTDGVLNNKYRSACRGRGRCGRGCNLQSSFHSPSALVYPARDSGNLTTRPYSLVSEVLVDPANKARGASCWAPGRSRARASCSTRSRARTPMASAIRRVSWGAISASTSWEFAAAVTFPRDLGARRRSTMGGRWDRIFRASATSPIASVISSADITSRTAAAAPNIPAWRTTFPAMARPSNRTSASTTPPSSASAALARCCRASRTASRLIRRSGPRGGFRSFAPITGSATTN